MVNPTPTISWINRSTTTGSLYWNYASCGTVLDAEGREVLPHGGIHLLGEMTIDWGRTDVWTQPDPAVATVVVWQSDAVAAGAAAPMALSVAGSGLVGQEFRIDVTKGGGTYRIFHGRISNVDAERMSVRTTRGIEPGWVFRVQASDKLGGLSQVDKQGLKTLTKGDTMKANADRLNTYASWVGIRETYFEATYQSGKCRQVDVGDKTLYDLYVEMYGSFGHQFTYNPRRNVCIRIPAAYAHGSYALRLARTTVGGIVRLYAPQWADSTGKEDAQDTAAYPTAYVGGNDVAGDVRLGSDRTTAISNIECKWTIEPGGATIISRVAVVSGQNLGLLRYDSWFSDGLQIDPIQLAVKNKCLAEGSMPFHPTITWDTAKTGDVPDWNTFESLTLPAQTVRMMVIAGSPFSAMMGYPPVWYPAGGVIAYKAGKWRFTINPAPAKITLSGTPIKFNNLSASTTGKTLTLGQLDRSISSYDLRYVTDPTLYTQE